MDLQTTDSFSHAELTLVNDAIEALAPFRVDPGRTTLRRDRMLQTGGKLHPTVMAVYVPQSRTAALFDGAFAGDRSVMPMGSKECVQAVLAAGLLDDLGLRSRWCKLLGGGAERAPAAAVLEASTIARLLAEPDGSCLALDSVGPETAFALAMAWSSSRARWFKTRRPTLFAFVNSLHSSPVHPLRG
jgi:hypothetical protein